MTFTILKMTYSSPKGDYSVIKATYSKPKVTYTYPNVAVALRWPTVTLNTFPYLHLPHMTTAWPLVKWN